jgi:16S rRNA (adenine1518-N6/adenine1519-N6)-dimethyltransferase
VGAAVGSGPGDPAYERLFTVVRGGFAHRRKMLRRSLEGLVRAEAFDATGIRATARAEELGLAEWERLAAWQPGDRVHPAFRTGS